MEDWQPMSGGVLEQRDRTGPLHSQETMTGPPTPRIIGPFHCPTEDQLDAGPTPSELLTVKCRPAKKKKRNQTSINLTVIYISMLKKHSMSVEINRIFINKHN